MLKLVIYPDEILDRVAEPVTEFNEELKNLIKEMFEVMEREGGIGLAAPQVGISKRIFVTKIDDVSLAFINPEILESDGEISIDEGCLSFPNVRVRIPRKRSITIKSQRTDGVHWQFTVLGLASICFQHELDHLNGITFMNALSPTTGVFVRNRLEREKNERANKE